MIKIKTKFGKKCKVKVKGTMTVIIMEIVFAVADCIRKATMCADDFNEMRDCIVDMLSNMEFSEDEDGGVYLDV